MLYIYLFSICNLFNDIFISSECVAFDGSVTSKYWIKRDVEGSVIFIIWGISGHLPGLTENHHEKSQ